MGEKLILQVRENFNLEKAVCNHGFFMMAPNLWMPSEKSLVRRLQLNNSSSKKDDDVSTVTISITQPLNKNFLQVTVLQYLPHQKGLLLSSQERQEIRDQVTRMLRLSAEDEMMVEEFHMVHPQAKKAGFARIFRSPTLFEDIVKSILLCYCTWPRSLRMAQALCDLQEKISKKGSKRKRSTIGGPVPNYLRVQNFPSSYEIACLDVNTLNEHCKLGYRASVILQVAHDIEAGKLNLGDYQSSYDDVTTGHKLFQQLLKIKGFGHFTAANILMCIGFYQEIPVDTETIKHLSEVHGVSNVSKRNKKEVIEQIYGKYAPFQCLVYWMEHVEYYEKRLGKLGDLPQSQYCNVTTTNFRLGNVGN